VLPLLLCTLLLAGLARPAPAMDLVRFPRPVSAQDPRRTYAWQLLTEVLQRTEAAYGPFKMVEAETAMSRRRMLLEMRTGEHVNVVANPADAEWLRELKAVMVPVDMGLQGWRIALIRQADQARLDQLHAPEELKALRVGTASAWVTTRALVSSGFNVVTGEDYEGLFGMLLAGRFDLLPRGLNEIFPEYDRHHAQAPELAVERRFLLHDHIAVVFFVSPAAPHLAERLAAGMEAMVKDGSLRRFLLSRYEDALHRAQLCDRMVMDLPRPTPPPELAKRPELWFDPLDPRNGICPARSTARQAS
jgi:hypothetical protein